MAVSRVSFEVSLPARRSLICRTECERLGEKTCVLWSTAGYAAQLSLVPCLAALISLLFIFLHRGELIVIVHPTRRLILKVIAAQEQRRGDSNGN